MIWWGPLDAQELPGRARFWIGTKGETCTCTQQGLASKPRVPFCAASLLSLLWEHLEETKHLTNATQCAELSRCLSWSMISSLGIRNYVNILCLLSSHKLGENMKYRPIEMGEIWDCFDVVTNFVGEYKIEMKSTNPRASLPGLKS